MILAAEETVRAALDRRPGLDDVAVKLKLVGTASGRRREQGGGRARAASWAARPPAASADTKTFHGSSIIDPIGG
jgi:hypothetical protein